jgi:hypothetical protein
MVTTYLNPRGEPNIRELEPSEPLVARTGRPPRYGHSVVMLSEARVGYVIYDDAFQANGVRSSTTNFIGIESCYGIRGVHALCASDPAKREMTL